MPPTGGGETFRAMKLYELKAEIPVDAADAADEVLLEQGIEAWSLLQDAIARRAWIVGIFPGGEDEARTRWAELMPLLAGAGVVPGGEPVMRALADQDWRDSYKAHFKAWRCGRLHWVPVWERDSYALFPGDAVIWLDPGLAFGTGNHETTRLCCERLVAFAAQFGVSGLGLGGGMTLGVMTSDAEENPPPSPAKTPNSKLQTQNRAAARVLDAGCGSGILALSAARLGFGNVAGFDNDPEAVRVSRENAALNGLAGAVEFYTGDLVTGLAGRQAELVLANIQADVLMRFVSELLGAVAPGGELVLSGILAVELERVRDVFTTAAPGWKVESRVLGEWADLRLSFSSEPV